MSVRRLSSLWASTPSPTPGGAMTRAEWGLGLLGLAMSAKLWVVDGQVRRAQQTLVEQTAVHDMMTLTQVVLNAESLKGLTSPPPPVMPQKPERRKWTVRRNWRFQPVAPDTK